MVATATHLDGAYAAFGRVTEGMEVAQAIVNVPRGANDKPNQDQRIESIRVETFGIEYPPVKIQ
jgi:peptidyl-prolyl cis-trans isomerase B (cyclophilin B)